MKGFISALIIFLSLISFLIVYNFYINATFTSFSVDIVKISDLIMSENYEAAKKSSEKFHENLNKKSAVLYLVTDRSPIDNALTESEKMLSFIDTEDKSEALACARGIDILLDKTKEKSLIFYF